MLDILEVVFLGLGFFFLMSCAGSLDQIKDALEKIADKM